MMDLQQLAMFAAVARHGNLTKASEELGSSEPTVSRYLKSLQDHYGTQFLRRVSKGVEVTPEGEAFLRRITPILEQVSALQITFKSSLAQDAHRILRVGGTFSASAELLPRLLAGMRRRHPGAEFAMRARTSDQLERLVVLSLMDLAVTAREAPSADLVSEPFLQEKVVLFVRSNHRLANKAQLTAGDLLKEPFVLRGGLGASGVTVKAIEKLRDGAAVKIGMYCDGPAAIKAAVRQKLGVGVVLAYAIRSEVASGEFKILKVPGLDFAGQSYIVYSKQRLLSPIAQEFLEMLRAEREKVNSRNVSKGSSGSKGSRGRGNI
jgi:DNA-binding transcriptional LysR family regulator